MNPFLLDPKARLADWKDFRKQLSLLPEDEQLQRIAAFWAKAPLGKPAFDLDEPADIAGPWEMISAGDWCENSVAIGMEFTLRLAGMASDRLELVLIRDHDISEMKVILIIDGQKVLNYSYGEVCDYPTSRHDVLGRWRFTGKFYAPVTY
jgi:hypothetical protein